MTPAGSLAALLRSHGLPPECRAPLAALLRETADADAPTAVHEPGQAIERHLADSLVALPVPAVAGARRVADLGSGAGLPGLALAAALPESRVALVESTRSKCRFLGRTVEAMGLQARASVVCERAEAWPDGLEQHDLVTARALASLPVLVEYAAPLLVLGGSLVAWKGRRDPAEEEAGVRAGDLLGMELVEVRAVRPYPRAQHRHLYVLRKIGATPAGYPRRPGMAVKRPIGARVSDRAPR